MRRTSLVSAIAVLATSLLLTACSNDPGQPAAQASPGPAPAGNSAVRAPHSLELQIGPQRHALDTGSARFWRGPVYGVDGVEAVELEVMDADNTVFAKADLFIAPGAALEGRYALGLRSQAGIVNSPGHGQVITAIEDVGDRAIRVSGDGTLTISREGGLLVARFDYSLNGFTAEPLDLPVSGVMRIREDQLGE